MQKQLANQLSESMLTHARQRGFVVYDYRLRGQLLLQADHEQALSRQLATAPVADLLVLPEMFASGFSMDSAGIAESMKSISGEAALPLQVRPPANEAGGQML